MPTAMEALYFAHYDAHVAKTGIKTAILLQVGSFFEMYDYVDKATGAARANVQILAEICGCTVDPKVSADPTKTRLFWGFPEISLAKFERLLVGAGYSVVVIVQNKDATGEVASRTLDHVSSPGTYWDAEGGLATRRDEQCMISLYIEPYTTTEVHTRRHHWYIATSAFDVMTGKSISTETTCALIDGKPVVDAIQPFWSMYPPAELVVYWCSEKAAPAEADICTLFPGLVASRRPTVHIRILDPVVESSAPADRLRLATLTDIYKPQSALSISEYLGMERHPFIRRSLSHLLQFIRDHNPSFLTALHDHRVWTPEDNVLLGNAALEQLAMIPLNAQRAHESLLHWLQKATTAMGKRALRERCLKPIADVDELRTRQERIALLRDATTRTTLERILHGMHDLSRLYRRFQLRTGIRGGGATGTTDDLLQLLTTYENVSLLLKHTHGELYGVQELETDLQEHIDSLLNLWSLERIRSNRTQVSDAVAFGSVHPWRRGIHADLDEFEDSWNILESDMKARCARWHSGIDETDVISWNLKEDAPFTFTTTARRAACIAAVEKKKYGEEMEIIKRGTSTTVTLETESVRSANVAAIQLRSKWRARIDQLWHETWNTWMETSISNGMLEVLVDWIGQLDAECAFADIAETYGYVQPIYVESCDAAPAGITITDLRHPIIERVHTNVPYISHSLSLGAFAKEGAASPHGILVYGVNAAGKSSLGKALGLAVLMAQCGIPVPASAMTLIPYTGLYTRILGNDNLWAGLSSFVVEMTEFRSILRSANARTLVIGDELCAGTETASATAIVAAGVQTLVAKKSHFFFATHLHELATIEEIANNSAIRFFHLTVRPDLERGALIYDRMLRAGCGSPMYGLEVCRGLDMDSGFLTSAFQFRKRLFAEDGMRLSRYNAGVVLVACEVCGVRSTLETHHIVPQRDAAADGTVRPGQSKHTASNLVALCDACHTKHHGGHIKVNQWTASSIGRVLDVSVCAASGLSP